MARIQTVVLKAVARLYGFRGSKSAPDTVDISAPTTIVHDVSRSAELGAASATGFGGGFWLTTVKNIHGGATRIDTPFNVYVPDPGTGFIQSNGYLVLNDEWVWYLKGFGVVNVGANFTEALIAAHPDMTAKLAGPNDNSTPVAVALTHFDDVSATSIDGTREVLKPLDQIQYFPLPRVANNKTQFHLRFVTEVSGAAEVSLVAMIWKGKIGTFPPGYS